MGVAGSRVPGTYVVALVNTRPCVTQAAAVPRHISKPDLRPRLRSLRAILIAARSAPYIRRRDRPRGAVAFPRAAMSFPAAGRLSNAFITLIGARRSNTARCALVLCDRLRRLAQQFRMIVPVESSRHRSATDLLTPEGHAVRKLGPRSRTGRIAQRKSIALTRRWSQVRTLLRLRALKT